MILVTKCVAFCVPGHWGATHILLMRMERLLFVPFFFFWRLIFWIKPISHSHECYISVNSRGQTVVEQNGCKVDFYGDERKQNTKLAHTFLVFLRIVL